MPSHTVGSALRPGADAAPDPAPTPATGPQWSFQGWSWLGLTALLVAARLPTFELWGDVRYTLGAERVTALTGWSSAEVWTHRPMINRVLMAGLDRLTSDPFREQQLLAWSALLAGGAVWLLHRQLVRWLGWVESAALCAALLVALVWAPAVDTLQPEWYATVTAVAAVGVAGLPRSRHRVLEVAVVLGCALLLVATVLMKWTTVSTAAAAAAVVLALCWRSRTRLVMIAVASVILLPAVLGLQVLLVPHEGQWLREVPLLNPARGALVWCPVGPAPTTDCGLQILLANEGITSPALVLLPAALVLLAGTARGRVRTAAIALPVVALIATLATTVAQGMWFPYHLTALPVMASGWLGWALARWIRGTPGRVSALSAGVVLAAAVSVWLLTRSFTVRTSTDPLWFGHRPATVAFAASAVVATAGVILALVDLGRARVAGPDQNGRHWTPALVWVVAVLAVCVNPLLTTTAYSFDFRADTKTVLVERHKASSFAVLGARVREVIGAETPVVYLSPGERSYWVRNPTFCRYGSPTYLQRSMYVDTSHLVGFEENLACLADPRAAYVVIEPGWFKRARVDPAVRQRLDEYYDCAQPVLVQPFTLICPRRPGR